MAREHTRKVKGKKTFVVVAVVPLPTHCTTVHPPPITTAATAAAAVTATSTVQQHHDTSNHHGLSRYCCTCSTVVQVPEDFRYYPSVNDDLPPGGALTFVDGLSVKKLPAIHIWMLFCSVAVENQDTQPMLSHKFKQLCIPHKSVLRTIATVAHTTLYTAYSSYVNG
eukprot:2856-Heterococcus_DN1.PRE.2